MPKKHVSNFQLIKLKMFIKESDVLEGFMGPRRKKIFYSVTLIFAVFAVVSRIWVAEDAYITFRSVQNLFAGYGPLFNPGEHVEVYTHPLWFLLLVIIRSIGVPLHAGSIFLGLIFTGAALALLIFAPARTNSYRGRFVFPIAALALLSISGFRDFATAGMEFAPVFFLLTLLYIELEHHELNHRPIFFSTVTTLLYLTRPELGLLFAWYSCFYLWELWLAFHLLIKEKNLNLSRELLWLFRRMLMWGLPFLLFAGGYHLFRYLYFGEIFPNTYHAKSGMESFTSQGLKYLTYTYLYAPALWILSVIVFVLPYSKVSKHLLPKRNYYPYLRELGSLILLVIYVIRLGGDFMAFRFLLPEIAMLALLSQRVLNHLPAWSTKQMSAFAFGGLFIFILLSFYHPPLSKGWIVDEREYFVSESQTPFYKLILGQDHPWKKRGDEFRKLQQCLDYSPFWIANSQASAKCTKGVGLGYFGVAAGPSVLIFDEQGLPDRYIAKQRLPMRFRPGHEHFTTLNDVIRKGALFCSSGESAYDRIMETEAGIVIRWDPELLMTLPRIRERLNMLAELKKEGSPIISDLESRYGYTVQDLIVMEQKRNQTPLYMEQEKCWSRFKGGRESFYF